MLSDIEIQMEYILPIFKKDYDTIFILS